MSLTSLTPQCSSYCQLISPVCVSSSCCLRWHTWESSRRLQLDSGSLWWLFGWDCLGGRGWPFRPCCWLSLFALGLGCSFCGSLLWLVSRKFRAATRLLISPFFGSFERQGLRPEHDWTDFLNVPNVPDVPDVPDLTSPASPTSPTSPTSLTSLT